jgi:putative transposase
VHLTLRARPGVRSLRHPSVFAAVRTALTAATHAAFRVVHYPVQSDHVHLIVEASDNASLSRGARGLSIRVARAVNCALRRSGPVWGDRYHTRALITPREVRHALVYVLMNFRKHLPRAASLSLDPCSSAGWFDGFSPAAPRPPCAPPEPSPTARPRTWLAAVGWRRHGLIRIDETPKRPSDGRNAKTPNHSS